jgi:hypothetical protein
MRRGFHNWFLMINALLTGARPRRSHRLAATAMRADALAGDRANRNPNRSRVVVEKLALSSLQISHANY